MIKNNRKKAVAQAISTAVALGWVIMQVESARAATLTVNNLNDSGVGSLRDTINIATSNDVVEFLLDSNPSTITLTSGTLAIANNFTINGPGANLLTISGNNQFPVFAINAADVTLSGLAIAGKINAYNSSSVTFTNSTISDGNAGQISVGGNNISIRDNSSIEGGTIVGNSGQISSGGNISVSGGNITITPVTLIVTTRVPEPSAIAGTILACSLAWLAKRKQAAFCKTKV
ncbi:PEP-CTERM sorting domain-containing protein [Nostoc sp. UIC 10890]